MQSQYDIVIRAVGSGIKQTASSLTDGFSRGAKAVRVFNAAVNGGRKSMNSLTGAIRGMIGAYAGWQAVTRSTDIMRQAEDAAFNLSASVEAANREFANVGTVAQWEGAVRRLSGELVIYSDTALKNAISRTVDMTKRLGLNADQMQEVIKRSADLGAGKTDLTGAIERVTAALRGEAESAEFLGLTLNETYVKGWYEANKQTEKAWKDLTDIEKAQVRYQVLLEQTAGFQGRAAKSAKTFGGAMQLVRKEVENAIVNNRDLAEAMTGLAMALRTNAGDIGAVVAELVSLVARVVEFVLAWKKTIIVLAGTAAAVSAIAKLVIVVRGLNAAFIVLTGSGIIAWLASLRAAIVAVTATAGAMTMAFTALVALMAAQGAVSIYRAVEAFISMRRAQDQAREAQERMLTSAGKLVDKLKEFADVRIPSDLNGLPVEQLEQFKESLIRARAYYVALRYQLEEKASEKTWFGVSTKAARQAAGELAGVQSRLAGINGDLERVSRAALAAGRSMEQPGQASMASAKALEEFETAAAKAFEEAAKRANAYADKVIAADQKIRALRLSTEDKVRALRRQGMDDEAAYRDRLLQIEEKLSRARRAAAGQDYETAEKYYRDVIGLAENSVGEIKKAGEKEEVVVPFDVSLDRAIETIEQASAELENRVLTPQREAARKSYEEWKARAAQIKAALDEAVEARTARVSIELERYEEIRGKLDDLARPLEKVITIRTVEKKAAGGTVGSAFAGRLPGYGGGDRVPILGEAGEFMVRKEAVRHYGEAFFAALNAMRLQVPGLIKARWGGMIPRVSMPIPRMMASGGAVAASAPAESIVLELRAGQQSLTTVASGGREAVRALERELIRMGLSHAS